MATSPFKGTASSKKDDIHTVRIPFIGYPNFRPVTDATKDSRFLNCYFDVVKSPITGETTYWLNKRPGLSLYSNPPGTTGVGRGVLSWKGDIYSVFGTKIYKNTTDLGVTLTTSTGKCGMSFTRPGATTQYLVINDGVKLYCIAETTGVVTTVTTNFPTPNTTDIVYKDGYFFVLKTNSTLWNCDVDDPTTWTTSKFITAQMQNSTGVGLANQNNILFVFGDNSTQVFFDNANAAGSPMNNMESAMQQIGAASNTSIVSDESQTTWVSNTRNGGYSVYTLDSITQEREIGYPALNRLLAEETTNISSVNAKLMRFAGRKFYVLNLPTTAKRTFVYDYGSDLWTEFADTTGSDVWPFVDSTQHGNIPIIQHRTNGKLYSVLSSVYQDESVNFNVLARFGRLDLDTASRKFCRRAELIGDRQTSTANVLLQYSDDDYQTLSTARTLDMSQTRPFCSNLGNFRRRAWQLSYSGNTPMRIQALELKLRLGDD